MCLYCAQYKTFRSTLLVPRRDTIAEITLGKFLISVENTRVTREVESILSIY